MWPAGLYPVLYAALTFALPSSPRPSLHPSLLFHERSVPVSNINVNSNALIIQNATLSEDPLVDCFKPGSELVFHIDPDDCDHAIDLLFHDPSGVMNKQTFSYHAVRIFSFSLALLYTPLITPPSQKQGGFGTPADWHNGRCQVLLTSGMPNVMDEFRLVDVIVAAQKILAECPRKSKTSLGGLTLVGNMKGFFVAVNGPEPVGLDGMGGNVTNAWWQDLETLEGGNVE